MEVIIAPLFNFGTFWKILKVFFENSYGLTTRRTEPDVLAKSKNNCQKVMQSMTLWELLLQHLLILRRGGRPYHFLGEKNFQKRRQKRHF